MAKTVGANQIERESGAAFLEFALAIIVFTAVLVGAFEVVRFYIVKQTLTSSANRAISIASVIPSLDSEDRVDCDFAPSSDALQAIAAVKNVAKKLPEQGIFGSQHTVDGIDVKLTLREGSSCQSLRQVLDSQPISIEITGRYQSLLPGIPEIAISGFASGYREPVFSSSFPGSVDCKGLNLDPNALPSDQECCGGQGHVLLDGECACPGFYREDSNGACTICESDVESCGDRAYWDSNDCNCMACRRDDQIRNPNISSQCICEDRDTMEPECWAQGKTFSEYSCNCSSCGYDGREFDPTTGECECFVDKEAKEAYCNSQNQRYYRWSCDSCGGECQNGTVANGDTCENCPLECPDGQSVDSSCASCECDNSYYFVNELGECELEADNE